MITGEQVWQAMVREDRETGEYYLDLLRDQSVIREMAEALPVILADMLEEKVTAASMARARSLVGRWQVDQQFFQRGEVVNPRIDPEVQDEVIRFAQRMEHSIRDLIALPDAEPKLSDTVSQLHGAANAAFGSGTLTFGALLELQPWVLVRWPAPVGMGALG